MLINNYLDCAEVSTSVRFSALCDIPAEEISDVFMFVKKKILLCVKCGHVSTATAKVRVERFKV